MNTPPPQSISTTPPTAAPAPGKKRRRLLLAGLLLVLALAAAAGFWIYLQSRGPGLPPIPEVDLAAADPEVAELIRKKIDNLKKDMRSAKAWGELAMVLDAHQFADQADVCYTAAAILDPSDPHWPYLHGYLLKDGAKREEAAVQYRKAAELSPKSSARLRLAELLVELNRLDEASKELDAFQKTQPDNPFGLFVQAQIAMARSDYRQALRLLLAVKDNPCLRMRSCTLRANVQNHLGDRPAAEQERQLLSTLSGDMPWKDEEVESVEALRVGLRVSIAKAQHMADAGRNVEALALFRKATERHPKSDFAWFRLAKHLANTGAAAEAEKAMLHALELRPRDHHLWHYLGVVRQTAGQHPRAIEAFEKAVELTQTDYESRLKLAESLEAEKKFADAAVVYRKILSMHPQIDQARLKLGQVLEKLEKYAEAADVYQEALKVAFPSDDFRAALQRVQAILKNRKK